MQEALITPPTVCVKHYINLVIVDFQRDGNSKLGTGKSFFDFENGSLR